MSDHLAALREQQFRNFIPEPVVDREPVFVHVPGSTSDIYHFCAKHRVQRGYGSDPLFILAACVGTTAEGITVICGVIEVGRPTKRHIGDQYVAEIWTIAHDIVPGVRRFLVARAVHASRTLGFHVLLAGKEPDESMLLDCGFDKDHEQRWYLDLARDPKERVFRQEYLGMPSWSGADPKPKKLSTKKDSIDV